MSRSSKNHGAGETEQPGKLFKAAIILGRPLRMHTWSGVSPMTPPFPPWWRGPRPGCAHVLPGLHKGEFSQALGETAKAKLGPRTASREERSVHRQFHMHWGVRWGILVKSTIHLGLNALQRLFGCVFQNVYYIRCFSICSVISVHGYFCLYY